MSISFVVRLICDNGNIVKDGAYILWRDKTVVVEVISEGCEIRVLTFRRQARVVQKDSSSMF